MRCDDPIVGSYVDDVLARFRDGGAPPEGRLYEVMDTGSDAPNARFRLQIDGRWVLGSGQVGHVVGDLFSRINLDAFGASPDRIAIHAGAVSTSVGTGVLLPAPSGSGKSTLVATLVRAGFGYLSDEAAVLDPEAGSLEPYPVHLSLKPGTQGRFPDVRPEDASIELGGSSWYVDPDALRPDSVAGACRVALVVPHRFEPGAPLRIEPIGRAEACGELARNLMLPARDTARGLGVLGRICRGARTVRLTYGDVDEAVAALGSLAVADPA